MKNLPPLPKKQVTAALVLFFLFCACYEFTLVNQPHSMETNSSFTVDINITTNDGSGNTWYSAFFGIKLPEGWTVEDNIAFTYNLGNGVFMYSDSASQAQENIDPAEEGYYWWVAQSEEEVEYDYDNVYSFSPEIFTDEQTGNFFLDYMAGSDGGYYGGGLNWARSNDHLITVGLPDEIIVTSAENDGPGSLREAIDDIDYYGSISFDLEEGNTITLTEEINIYKDVQISGDSIDPLTISGGNSTQVLFINTLSKPVLSNLIIANGHAELGGGMFCEYQSEPALENIRFEFNSADAYGGAIYLHQSSPALSQVTITHNNADRGGGIYCDNESSPILSLVTISNNAAQDYGGGIYNDWNSTPVFDSINRSSIFLNNAMYGTDLSTETIMEVYLDTFTVLIPTQMHANPISSFTFDILNGKIEQVTEDLYVSPDGNNENSGLSPDEALKTINVALLKILTSASDPGTIHLLDGTYSPSTNGETFPVIMRDYLSVIGESEATVLLDAEHQSQLFTLQNITSSNIKNMTLTGGMNTNGGAIFCLASSPVLENVTITGNKASWDGGGIYLQDGGTMELINVSIHGNTSSGFGGGIYCGWAELVFSNTELCDIYLNMANYGNDISTADYMNIALDTFTVISPNEYQAYPLYNFDFDIQNGIKELVSQDLYISPDGDNLNSGLTLSDPLRNINLAYSLLSIEDEETYDINILDGTYSPSSNNEVFPLNPPDQVNLIGSNKENVILDAEQTSTVIEMSQGQTSKIANLTITGGQNQWNDGGGIVIHYSDPILENLIIHDNHAGYGAGLNIYYASPTISHLEIYNNTSDSYGGGMYCYDVSNMPMNDLILYNNTSQYGGAIYLEDSNPEMEDIVIYNNTATSSGGGLYCGWSSSPDLHNVSIRQNTSYNGGGVYFANYADPVFDTTDRCNIYLNTADNGADLYASSSTEVEIVVDTFTVLYPKYIHAYPLANFNFDIQHGVIPQVEADLYVSPTGDDNNTGTTSDDPLKTISHALIKIVEDSLNLYTIHLLAGTYSPSTNGEDYPLIMAEYVNLSGTSSDEVFLDAEGTNYVLHCEDVTNLTVSGLTITGGVNNNGGGIYCDNSSPTFENTVITNNSAYSYGGGVYCGYNESPTFINTTISGNTAAYNGGGAYFGYLTESMFINCIIEDNISQSDGGGIFTSEGIIGLEDVIISGNQALYSGGGINCSYYATVNLKNVSIINNSAQTGGGLYVYDYSTVLFDSIDRSDIYFNEATNGREIYSMSFIDVVVDTFTVMYPSEYFVEPLENFSFDILNYKIEQVNDDLFVSVDGDDENSGLTTSDPLKTINRAFMKIMADSIYQHTVFLMDGIYGPSTNGEVFPLKMIDYVSISGMDEYATILDGEDETGILMFDNAIGNTISDLTLRNGNAYEGGAIYCFESSPVLVNLNITSNTANYSGGGVYCTNLSNPEITNVTFSKNKANYGGGLYMYWSEPQITNSRFKNNTAEWSGGGVMCRNSSNPVFTNSIFTGNTSDVGGAVTCDNDCNPVFEMVTLSSNFATTGGGLYCISNSNPVLINTDIHHNQADEQAGGLYCGYYSAPVFDTVSRCNIFLNKADRAMDLYSDGTLNVVVDTFTVLYPTKYFAEPLDNFEFDILHGLIEQADTNLYVSPSGDNSNSGLSALEPLKTIHYACSKIISSSENPRTVYLLDGTYSPSLSGENFPVNPLDYLTISGSSPDMVILDAESSDRVMDISSASGVEISNLTIMNGSADRGAGIACNDFSSPILTNLVIKDNVAQYSGGGIYCYNGSSPIMENVILSNNVANDGGAISASDMSSPMVSNSIITGNVALYTGGGVYLYHESSALFDSVYIGSNEAGSEGGGIAILYCTEAALINTVIENNISQYNGGGVYTRESSPALEEVTISDNESMYGGGYYNDYYSSPFFSNVTIKNNWASSYGGGVYSYSFATINFSSVNRSNIYFNYAQLGNDLYTDGQLNVVLDTFTVLMPKGNQAYPLPNYTFDILHGMLPQEQLELYVSPEGDNSNSGQSPDDPLKNIQYAITSVAEDSLNFYDVYLLPGTYSPTSNEETYPVELEDFITLTGSSAEETILDAENTTNIIHIIGKMNVEISNMTLTGGGGTYGGAVYVHSSNPLLDNLILEDNSSNSGGAIYCNLSGMTVSNSEFIGNTANSNGGAIDCQNSPVMHLENVIFMENESPYGGALYFEDSYPVLDQLTITNNSAHYGGGIYTSDYTTMYIENSEISFNTSQSHGGGIYAYYYNNMDLEGTSIIHNSALGDGGGIYSDYNSFVTFDYENRSNIFLNNADNGDDLYSTEWMEVIVDTFTVINPKSQHAHPMSNFTFDILNGKIPQIHADIYVSPDGDNTNSGLDPDNPLKTINYALSVVAEDSINIYTINLMEGVYSPETNGETFPIYMVHYITLMGSAPDEVVLDAQGMSGVVNLTDIQGATISDLTITGGQEEYNGGGIQCINSSPEIENVIISGNEASTGAGIYCYDHSSPLIKNVTISNNIASSGSGSGGGIYLRDKCDPEITNVIIENNTANSFGGGLYCDDYSNPTLNDVLIQGNNAQNGGGIYTTSYSQLMVQNSQILDNAASSYGGGISNTSNSIITLEQVRITNNTGGSFGGGISNINNSEILFDTINRSSIYLNHAQQGNELYSQSEMFVVVDTFTVMFPKNYHSYPRYKFEFDILFGLFPQVSADLYVSPEGDNQNSGLSPEEPLRNIHFATSIIAEDSLNLYTIHLANGIYSPSTNEEYFPIYIPEHVGLQGEDMMSTILDAEESAKVMSFSYSHNVTVKNLTLKGGHDEIGFGGGIHMEHSSPTMININVEGNYARYGGGIYLEKSSPVLRGIRVIDNSSFYSGAGICCFDHSSPDIDSATIWSNSTQTYGGGIYCSNYSSPTINNVSIMYNMASTGAAMYCGNNSNPVIEDAIISNNEAEHSGGGIYGPYSNLSINRSVISGNICTSKGGGLYVSNFTNSIQNTIITNNSAEDGGGMYFSGSEPILLNLVVADNVSERYGGGIYLSVSDPIIENLTISNNLAEFGSGIFSYRANMDIKNTILWNTDGDEVQFKDSGNPSSITLEYTDIQGGESSIITNDNGTIYWLDGNIDEDPAFEGTGDHPYNLVEGSPCIEAGTPDTISLYMIPTDILGNHRFWDGDGDGDTLIDMGAYEYGSIVYIVGMDKPEKRMAAGITLKVYPNPVEHVATFRIESNRPVDVRIELKDLSGNTVRVLAQGLPVDGVVKHSYNLEKLQTGVYFVQMYSGTEVVTKKIVKVR